MKHRKSPQGKTLTHICVRDEQKGYLRPCWASGHTVYCGMCLQGVVQAEIGARCPACSSTVEHMLESVRGGVPGLLRRSSRAIHAAAARKKPA